MKFELLNTRPRSAAADTLVVGLYEEKMFTSALAEVDELAGGLFKKLIESGDLVGKLGHLQLLFQPTGTPVARVLVVGLGEQRKFDATRFARVVKDAANRLKGTPAKVVANYLTEVEVPGRDLAWKLKRTVLLSDYAAYRYSATLKGSDKPTPGIERWQLSAPNYDGAALVTAEAQAAGIRLARELGNLPPNICNPVYLAQQAQELAQRHPEIRVDVLDSTRMAELKMGALLAVARGSANAPKLIVMEYRGGGDAAPYVFVGKGITFDTGGTNIKPSAGMEEMKFDMCGAGAVFGLMQAVALLKPKLNVVGLAPAVENMPGGDAYRPSDVVTTMAGHTVEVLNTDAEGRLILCDALTYAQQQFKPHTLIDIATLTGACVVALGSHATGLMSHDDTLAADLLAIGEQHQDRAWRLPLWDDYQSQLETGFADFANIGGKNAGAITAGCFLSRFTEGTRWAHLDIAGTAWDSGRKGTATGRPVTLLAEWLLAQQTC